MNRKCGLIYLPLTILSFQLEEVVRVVKARQWRVKHLMEFTQRICINAFEQFDQDDKITMDLFDELLSFDDETSIETHSVKKS